MVVNSGSANTFIIIIEYIPNLVACFCKLRAGVWSAAGTFVPFVRGDPGYYNSISHR
jgi:hypothetical protein